MASLDELKQAPIFHLALPVTSLEDAEAFYGDLLGCATGRRGTRWIDFNFFGAQLTVHLVDAAPADQAKNAVDGHAIPARHFGMVLGWEDWHRAVDHLSYVGVEFRVTPHIRFEGEVGEQATFFVSDPSGNCIEFKAFKDPECLFRAD